MTNITENRPVLDMETVIRDKFAAGEGVVCLLADMDDAAILAAIKSAAAYGMPFQVIIPPKADGRGIGSHPITVNQTAADFERLLANSRSIGIHPITVNQTAADFDKVFKTQ